MYSARFAGTVPNGVQTARPIIGQRPFTKESLAYLKMVTFLVGHFMKIKKIMDSVMPPSAPQNDTYPE